MKDAFTEKIWAHAASTLSELLQEGCAASMQALELLQALEESKSLGGVTNRLALVHSRIITARAKAQIEAIKEGRMPSQHLNHRQGFKN